MQGPQRTDRGAGSAARGTGTCELHNSSLSTELGSSEERQALLLVRHFSSPLLAIVPQALSLVGAPTASLHSED